MPDDLVYELHLHFSTSEQSEILIGMCSFLEVAALEERADKVIIYSADLPYVHRLREELSSHLSWLTDDTIDIQQKKNENFDRKVFTFTKKRSFVRQTAISASGRLPTQS